MGTVVSVDEVWAGDAASISAGSDGAGSAKVARKFQVVVNNTGGVVNSLEVLTDLRLPHVNEPFPL